MVKKMDSGGMGSKSHGAEYNLDKLNRSWLSLSCEKDFHMYFKVYLGNNWLLCSLSVTKKSGFLMLGHIYGAFTLHKETNYSDKVSRAHNHAHSFIRLPT